MARDFTGGGSGPYLTVAATALLGMASPITIAAWVTADVTGTLSLVGKQANRWLVDHNALAPRITTVPTGLTFSGPVVSAGVLHHLAFVLDGASSLIYRQGAQIASGTVNGFTAANETILIGNRTDATNLDHNGIIADLGIWAAVLNDRELKSLARGVSPALVRPAALRAWWPMYGLSLPEVDWKSRLQATLTRSTLPAARHVPSSPVAL